MLQSLLAFLGLRRPAEPATRPAALPVFEPRPLPGPQSDWAVDVFVWACAKRRGQVAVPGLRRVPEHFKRWLETLTADEIAIVAARLPFQIERHLRWRDRSDLIRGLRPYEPVPESEPPPSKRPGGSARGGRKPDAAFADVEISLQEALGLLGGRRPR